MIAVIRKSAIQYLSFVPLMLGCAWLTICTRQPVYAQAAPTKAERLARLQDRQGRLLAILDMSKLNGNIVQEDFAEQLVDDAAAEIAALEAQPDDPGPQMKPESLEVVRDFPLTAGATEGAAHYRHHGQAVLNDPVATPGAVDTKLTKAELCDPSFHTGTVRDVTESQKKRVCLEYGIAAGCPGKGYEIDHLVSIEVGGSNDDANLWPQPADRPGVVGFHTKDVVENRAHKAVCEGRLTLREAQTGIRTDWYAFGLKNGFLEPAGGEKGKNAPGGP